MYYQKPTIPPCVKGIIIANVAMFVVQLLPWLGDRVTFYGAMIPRETFGGLQIWRLATYMFLHSPSMIFHILFNMLALYWFGVELENIWGRKKFLIFYAVCGVGAGLFSLAYLFINPHVLIIGASGAVLGVMTAYACYYPSRQILLFFIFPVRIRTLVIGYAVISVLFSARGDGTAHLTHLGGILVAYLYIKIFPMVQTKFESWYYEYEQRKKESAKVRDVYRKRHFEQVIDPILDKISQSGLESLTPAELSTLKKASRKDSDLFRGKKIMPFFRK